MVVEPAPAAALVVPEPQFLLELLVIALDAPPGLGKFDQARRRYPPAGSRASIWWAPSRLQATRSRAIPAGAVRSASSRDERLAPARSARGADQLRPRARRCGSTPPAQEPAPAPSPRSAGARHPGASAWAAVPGPTRAWAAAVRSPAPKPRCLTGSPPCS